MIRNPFGISLCLECRWIAIGPGLIGLLLGCAVLAVWSLFSRSQARLISVERLQIKWLAYSGCLVALTLVPSTILSEILLLSAGIAWPCHRGRADARHLDRAGRGGGRGPQEWPYDIDRIISRTLAYATVTGLLVGLYAGLVLAGHPGAVVPQHGCRGSLHAGGRRAV